MVRTVRNFRIAGLCGIVTVSIKLVLVLVGGDVEVTAVELAESFSHTRLLVIDGFDTLRLGRTSSFFFSHRSRHSVRINIVHHRIHRGNEGLSGRGLQYFPKNNDWIRLADVTDQQKFGEPRRGFKTQAKITNSVVADFAVRGAFDAGVAEMRLGY
ncbi:hypothetical protein DXD41_02705 [Bifidobacterium longum]|nr:hypothetical protein DXD41_02705 [Bifidobacterium longum]RGJ97537.1 hypothetical protein DXD37_10295 [Bifidobacterium longum]